MPDRCPSMVRRRTGSDAAEHTPQTRRADGNGTGWLTHEQNGTRVQTVCYRKPEDVISGPSRFSAGTQECRLGNKAVML